MLLDALGDRRQLFVDEIRGQLSSGTPAERKVVDLVNEQMNSSRMEMSKRYTPWNKVERNYWLDVDQEEIQRLKDKNLPTFDKSIVMPITHFHINSRVTNLMQLLFKRYPLFSLTPRGDSSLELVVKKLQMLLQYQVQRSKIIEYGHNLLHNAELYGASFGKTDYNFRRQLNESHVSDPFETFPDVRQGMIEVENMDFVGFQYRRSYNQLAAQPHYFNLDNIRALDGRTSFAHDWDLSGDRTFGQSSSVRSVRDPIVGHTRIQGGKTGPKDRGVYLLHELWTRIIASDYFDVDDLIEILEDNGGSVPKDFDPNLPQVWVFSVVNGHTVIRAEPSPLGYDGLPVGIISPLYDGLSMLPKGIAEVMAPLQEVCSWLITSRMDNVYKMINEKIVIDEQMLHMDDVESGELTWRMNPTYAGQGLVNRAVHVITPSNVTDSHWRDLQQFVEILQRLTSATDTVQGQSEKIEQTLGQFEGLLGQALGRIADTAERYHQQYFYEWAEMLIANTVQFMPEEIQVRMSADLQREFQVFKDQKYVTLNRDEVKDILVDIEPYDPTAPPKKASALQVLKSMLEVFGQSPELQARYPQAVENIVVAIAKYADLPQPERILAGPEPGPAPQPTANEDINQFLEQIEGGSMSPEDLQALIGGAGPSAEAQLLTTGGGPGIGGGSIVQTR